jgi:short-subunit dehydrogenase
MYYRMLSDIFEVLCFLLVWVVDLLKETFYAIFRCRPRKKIGNENILITGSGQGLGRLISERLAKDGNILHCVDINQTMNENMAAELRKKESNCTIYTYTCDVGETASITELGRQIKENVPDRHISYLFNIAGIVMGKSFAEETDKQMEKVIKVNVLGVMYLQKMVYKEMLDNYGHIVNISSLAGILAAPLLADYCCSKYAVRGLTQSMLSEMEFLGVKNVKFTSVHPHVIKTGMFNNTQAKWPHVFPLLEPEWVADQIIIGTQEEREQLILPKITLLFLMVEPFMSTKVFRKYGDVLGNGMMKTFKKIREE